MSQQHTLFWSPELHALGVSPVWTEWCPFCCGGLTTMGGWPWTGCFPCCALGGGCWLLIGKAGHEMLSCGAQGGCGLVQG